MIQLPWESGSPGPDTGSQALACSHFFGAHGEEIRAMQTEAMCKYKVGTDTAELWVAALAVWLLAPAHLDVFGRDQHKHQSWCLTRVQRIQFTEQLDISWGSGSRLKRGAHGHVAPSPQQGQLRVHKGSLAPVQLI